MESREWRYGWAADDPRWIARPADTTARGASANPTVTSTGGIPALRDPTGQQPTVRPGFGLTSSLGRAPTAASQPAAGPWSRRARAASRQPREPRTDDGEPGYVAVLVLTAGWYVLPGALYTVWLIAFGGDGPGLDGHRLATGLPWLLASLVLSLAVAGLLRWAIVGWRALTISFAAAVIGAGMATIAHSLSF